MICFCVTCYACLCNNELYCPVLCAALCCKVERCPLYINLISDPTAVQHMKPSLNCTDLFIAGCYNCCQYQLLGLERRWCRYFTMSILRQVQLNIEHWLKMQEAEDAEMCCEGGSVI